MTRSDSRNKEVALGRIKRLASSGLPLEPFVRTIFELVNDALPSSPNKNFMVGGSGSDTYIGSTREANEVVPTHQRFFAESSPEVSGSKISFDTRTMHELFPSETIWTHEEIARPDFYSTEGFNAVFRPLGFHHSVVAVFQESGGFLGYYPVWRSVDQKPFSRDDADFLRNAAPHIAHGLRAAQLIASGESSSATPDDVQPLSAWRAGVVLIDSSGKLLAIDSDARLSFQQLGVLDGITVDQFAPSPVRDGLAIYRGCYPRFFAAPKLTPSALRRPFIASITIGLGSFSNCAASG